MAGISKMYDSLKTEYIKAENELKSVDQNLKKLIGNDSFDKNLSNSRKSDTTRTNRNFEEDRRYNRSTEMLSRKRRRLSDSNSSIFSRLDKKFDDGDRKRPSLQSAIVPAKGNSAKVKEENTIQDKEPDKKNDTRNRRMFGMIMGTLQKFQNEESQRKTTTTKREEIEKKLDKADAEEKEAVKKEKISLIKTKKTKQTKLRDIEEKMAKVEIHQQCEKSNQHLSNFIQTKAKPHIFYMPVKLTPETEKKLKDTKDKYLLIQAEKRAKIQKEIEDLNKKEDDQLSKDEADDNENKSEDEKSPKEIKKIKLNNSDGELNDNELKNDKENKTDLNKDSQINNENKKDHNLKDGLNNKDNKINNLVNNDKNDTFNDDLNNKEFINDKSNDNQFNSSKHNLINSENDNKLKEHDKTTTKQTNEKILNEEFEPIYDE